MFVGVISLVAGAVLVRLDLDFKTRGNSWVIEDAVMVADRGSRPPEAQAGAEKAGPPKSTTDKTDRKAAAAGHEAMDKPGAEDDAVAARELVRKEAELARRKAALASERREEMARRERERQAALRRAAEAQRALARQQAIETRKAAEAAKLAAALDAKKAREKFEREIVIGASARVGQRAGVEASFATHAVARGVRLLQPMLRRTTAVRLGAAIGQAGPQQALMTRRGAEQAAQNVLRLRADQVAAGLGQNGVLAYKGDFRLNHIVGNFNARMFGMRAALSGPEADRAIGLAGAGGGRLQLAYLSESLAASPLLPMAGLANSLKGADFLKDKNRMWKLGARLSRQYFSFGRAGFGVLANRVRPALSQRALNKAALGNRLNKGGPDEVGTVARAEMAAAFGPLGKPMTDEEAFAGMSCSERFYTAMQTIKAERIAKIKEVVKPISGYDKSLPGRWVFAMGRATKRSVCVRYKTYYSGRRKCIKRAVRYSKPQGGEFLSDEEEAFVAAARKLVAAKGRDAMVKPRSANYWVINRVARDLRIYTGQPLHPAICTGVPRMVDYFEGNLTKVKKHVAGRNELAETGDGLLARRINRLEAALNPAAISGEFDEMAPRIEWQARPTSRQLLTTPGATPLQTLVRLTEAVFGFEAARGVEVEDGFIAALRQVRKLYDSKRQRFTADGAAAFAGTMAVLEAYFYIDRSDNLYQQLATSMFDSLGLLRAAYKRHCSCDAALGKLPIKQGAATAQ